jgi:hypothetical protein
VHLTGIVVGPGHSGANLHGENIHRKVGGILGVCELIGGSQVLCGPGPGENRYRFRCSPLPVALG